MAKSARKTLPPKKRRRSSLNGRNFKLKLKRGTLQSLAAICAIVVSGLLAVSFTEQSPWLARLNRFQQGLLGWTAIFLPFLLLSIGLILANYSLPFTQPHVLIGTILLIISLAGLSGAGDVGSEIWESLSLVITTPGAVLLLGSAVLIGLLVLFNLSLDQIVLAVMKVLSQLRKSIAAFQIDQTEEAGKPALNASGLSNREMTIKGATVESKSSNQQEDREPPVQVKKIEPPSDLPASVMNQQLSHQIWELPPLSLLDNTISGKADRGDVKKNAAIIERTLESFSISAKVVEVNLGPAVTQYALEVALGTKVSKITSLGSDLALALAARTGLIRVEAPIPGRSLVGIELPNLTPEFVGLRKMLQSDSLKHARSKISVALGLDVAGNPKSLDLAKMPHLLIAGSTGSGKSVCINAFIASLLFRAAPTEVKFIMVDPKRVELTRYNAIPHLLTPVIVEPQKVLSALKWSTAEMDRRYKLFAEVGARNLDSYNELSGFHALPYIVIIIDELADVMLFAPSEVEDAICRLAQMARATGIHLVIATQRPSVDVLTGLIKANIPARVAFAVSSMTDSRVVLDTPGAEKLLGMGDMLFLAPDQAKPIRVQGAFVSDTEVGRMLEFIKNQGIPAEYTEEVTTTPTGKISSGIGKGSGMEDSQPDDRDDMFVQAIRAVAASNQGSASLLQRKLSIGYARAARILDQMHELGLVGPADGSKARDVHMSAITEYLGNRGGE